eukprot:791598_1
MAHQAAREYTTCCNCEDEKSTEPLYMCTNKSCSKLGDIFCRDCGQLSHRSKDHSFEIEDDHIKVVDSSVIQEHINNGLEIVKTALALYNDKKKEIRRTFTQAGVGTVATMGTLSSGLVLGFIYFSAGMVGFAGAYGGVYIAGLETIIQTRRFMKGEIKTWKEYGYHMAKGWTAAGGCSLCGMAGAYVGAAIGLIGGPIGGIIGAVIGGIAGGVIGAKLSRSAFESCFPDDKFENEQIGRREMIMDSLKLFGFSNIKDIKNPEIFNTVELKKIYRTLARRYHPDRNAGSDESKQKFQEVNAALGVLLCLLEKKDKGYVIETMTEIKAIKWKREIEELRQLLVESKLMYIVYICNERDKRATLEKISKYRKQDILELIQEMNEVSVIDRDEFADIIAAWNGTGLENDFFFRNEDSKENKDEEAAIDVVNEPMDDLMNELRKHKLLDVVQMCQELNGEYCLESLLEYSKNDILEVINEINDDDANNHKISVARKNKFAKIICNFVAK